MGYKILWAVVIPLEYVLSDYDHCNVAVIAFQNWTQHYRYCKKGLSVTPNIFKNNDGINSNKLYNYIYECYLSSTYERVQENRRI